jgi:uncharacterized membrane protein
MGYIIALASLFLIFAFMHYFTELNKNQKLTVILVLVSFITFAYIYNFYQNNQREKMYEIVVKYKQGKTIKCGRYDINSTNFSLSTGTYTFIGKENTPYYSIMISAYKCEN